MFKYNNSIPQLSDGLPPLTDTYACKKLINTVLKHSLALGVQKYGELKDKYGKQNIILWYFNQSYTDEERKELIDKVLRCKIGYAIDDLLEIRFSGKNLLHWYFNQCSNNEEYVAFITKVVKSGFSVIIETLENLQLETEQSALLFYLAPSKIPLSDAEKQKRFKWVISSSLTKKKKEIYLLEALQCYGNHSFLLEMSIGKKYRNFWNETIKPLLKIPGKIRSIERETKSFPGERSTTATLAAPDPAPLGPPSKRCKIDLEENISSPSGSEVVTAIDELSNSSKSVSASYISPHPFFLKKQPIEERPIKPSIFDDENPSIPFSPSSFFAEEIDEITEGKISESISP